MTMQQEGLPLKLRDKYGRVATDLRISITDRCNLRCTYCMPAAGLEWLPSSQVLTAAEIGRLCRVGVEYLGIEKIRFTGGEPLLRKDLEQIIAMASGFKTAAGEKVTVALTTNGLGLDKRAAALAAAGLRRINVSLDTVDPTHFAAITRRTRLDHVLAGLAAAKHAGISPIKVNAVLMRGINEDDALPLLDFCLEQGFELRFIEQMPIGPRESWDRQSVILQAEILEKIEQKYQLVPACDDNPHSPARTWSIVGYPAAKVGIIASVSAPFCHACTRTRITADGFMRSCLFSTVETDLREVLRSTASDAEIARVWAAGMWHKPLAHGLDSQEFAVASRTMSRIGG